jgi:hypothetical protein
MVWQPHSETVRHLTKTRRRKLSTTCYSFGIFRFTPYLAGCLKWFLDNSVDFYAGASSFANARSSKTNFYSTLVNREEEIHKNYISGQWGSNSFIIWSVPTGSDPCRHKTSHKVRGALPDIIFKRATIWKWRVHWLEVTEKERCNVFQ